MWQRLLGKSKQRRVGARAAAPNDVAILRLDNLGDAILTSGFLAALRAAWPATRITVFCGMAGASFFARCPAVNGVVPIPTINPQPRLSDQARSNVQRFGESYAGAFDVLINPRGAPDLYGAALYAAASQAPQRIAFRQTDFVNGFNPNEGYNLLVDLPAELEHPARIGHRLLAALGLSPDLPPPAIVVGPSARRRAKEFLADDKRYVALGIGAALDYKIWPPENFAAVATALAKVGYHCVLIGTEPERPQAARFKNAVDVPFVDLLGKTNVEEAAAVIGRCALFIGNDSGPKHIAAAVGTPIVEFVCFGERTPGFRYDRGFTAIGTPSVRIGPIADFDYQQTVSGMGIRSIAPDHVLAAAARFLR